MNIKIVICFILIISFIPGISFAATEKVWSAKYSGFIRSNESLMFENYIVKANPIDNDRSSIIVYRDGIELEKKDFNVNEFKKYDSVGISLLGIDRDYSWIAFSRMEDKDIWIPSGQKILKWGETFRFEDMSIEIEAIGKDSVNLSITKNNTITKDVFTNNSYRNFDNIRMAIMGINRTGLIDIGFFKYNTTTFKTNIITDKEEYFPDEKIPVSINITGDQMINIAGISLDGDNSVQFEPAHFTGTGILGTRSFRTQINKLIPDSNININARITVRDYRNNIYTTNLKKAVYITPLISIRKSVPEETDDENVLVELSIYNSGSKRSFAYIQDNVTEEITTDQMTWNIELEPKRSTNISYFISPQKPGIYQLSAATAKWDGEMSSSKRVNFTVHMPYIIMTKTASDNESLTDVELEIKNIGDRPAIVTVEDKIPDGFPVEIGPAKWSGYVDAGKSAGFKYSLKGNAVSLPAANASYRDIRGTIRQAVSNTVLNKKAPASKEIETIPMTIGKYEIIFFMISSFLIIFGIIGGIAFTAYLITKTRTGTK